MTNKKFSPIMIMRLAIDSNNLGVQHHQGGRLRESLQMFQGSLQMLMYATKTFMRPMWTEIVGFLRMFWNT